MTTSAVVKPKSSKLAFAAYICALFMTIWAVLLDITTFATNDYTWILIRAMSFAAGAVMLLLIAWRRIPIPGRAIKPDHRIVHSATQDGRIQVPAGTLLESALAVPMNL